jgi:hypothetical protein
MMGQATCAIAWSNSLSIGWSHPIGKCSKAAKPQKVRLISKRPTQARVSPSAVVPVVLFAW